MPSPRRRRTTLRSACFAGSSTNQVEEEENAADIIASLEQVGGDKLGMFMIDKELASRTYSAPSILSQKD